MRVILIVGALLIALIGFGMTIGVVVAYTTSQGDSVNQLVAEERYSEALPAAERQLRLARFIAGFAPEGGYADELATSLHRLAEINKNLGLLDKAEALHLEAVALMGKHHGEDSVTYAAYANDLAVMYHETGDNDSAFPLAEQVVDIRRRALGETNPSYAVALNNIGRITHFLGQLDESLAYYEEGQKILHDLQLTGNENYQYLLNNLAELHLDRGDSEQAIALQREVVALVETERGEGSREYATVINNLAHLLQRAGEYDSARTYYSEALERFEAIGETASPTYAIVLSNLAYSHSLDGEYDKCEDYLRRALDIQEVAVGPFNSSYLDDLESLATACDMQDKLEEAESYYRKAAALTAESMGHGSEDHLARLESIAWFFDGNQQIDAAEAELLDAIALAKEVQGEASPVYTNLLDSLGVVLRYSEEGERARPHYELLGEVLLRNHGPLSLEFLQYNYDFIDYLGEIEADGEALERLDGLLAKLELAGSEHRSAYVDALQYAAYFHWEAEAYEKAEEYLTMTLPDVEAEYGRESESYSYTLWDLAAIHVDQEDYHAAESVLLDMVAIDRAIYAEDKYALGNSYRHMAEFYSGRERDADAERYYRMALSLYEDGQAPDDPFYPRANGVESLVKLLLKRDGIEEAAALTEATLRACVAFEAQVDSETEYYHGYARSRLYATRARIYAAAGDSGLAEQSYLSAKGLMDSMEAQYYEYYGELCAEIAAFYSTAGDEEKAAAVLADIPEEATESDEDAPIPALEASL